MGMKSNITVEIALDDIDEADLITYVQKTYRPEDVFDSADLELWATQNGFIEEGLCP